MTIHSVPLTAEQKEGLNVGPPATLLPGPGQPIAMPIPGDGIPRAGVHGARAPWLRWVVAVGVVAAIGVGTVNLLLNRIDAANAYSARAYAHTKLLEVEVVRLRAQPAAETVDRVCRARISALRSAMQTWTRIGRAEFAEWPGTGWADAKLWAEAK